MSVELHDDGGTANGGVDTSGIFTFAIDVTPVNDAPSYTKGGDQAAYEGTGPHSVNGWATSISAGPADENSQTLNFIVSNDNNALFAIPPAISPSGNLTYTLEPHASGTANVSVQLHDSGGTANGGVDVSAVQNFVITVQFVNQPPSFAPGVTQSVKEDSGATTASGWATSISPGPGNGDVGQTLNFIVTNNNNALFAVQPAIDPTTGDLTFTLAPNSSGVATVSVQLHDDGGTANGGVDTSAIESFTITATFVNKAPSFTKGADQTINENSGVHVVSNWATNISPGVGANEAGQSLDFIVTNDNHALFSIQPSVNPLTGALNYTLAPNASGTATVSVQLHDDGGTANGGVDVSALQDLHDYGQPHQLGAQIHPGRRSERR